MENWVLSIATAAALIPPRRNLRMAIKRWTVDEAYYGRYFYSLHDTFLDRYDGRL